MRTMNVPEMVTCVGLYWGRDQSCHQWGSSDPNTHQVDLIHDSLKSRQDGTEEHPTKRDCRIEIISQ